MSQLVVVGSGIKTIAHFTQETRLIIKKACKVLYLVNEDNLKAWIQRESKEAESLEPLYFNSARRADAYKQITDYIIEQYAQVGILCVIFYGHPTIFAQSALNAVKKIKNKNGKAIILPAISTMDCLFSDLEIDPGRQGCFTIDATELLIYERTLDVYGHVIIWQIANLGRYDRQLTSKLNIFLNFLEQYYPLNHPICIYEAAFIPKQKPRIDWSPLNKLPLIDIKPFSTLYIPPLTQKKLSKTYLKLLEVDPLDFKLSSKLNTASE